MTFRIITAFFMTALLFGTIPAQFSSCAAAQEAERAEIEQSEDTEGTKDPEDETENKEPAVEEGRAGENEPEIEYPEPTEEEKARIEELIKQLGSEDHRKRETTQKALIKMGQVVVPLLTKAVRTDKDLEVVARCKQIVAILARKRLQEKWAVSDLLLKKIPEILDVLEKGDRNDLLKMTLRLNKIGTIDVLPLIVQMRNRNLGYGILPWIYRKFPMHGVKGMKYLFEIRDVGKTGYFMEMAFPSKSSLDPDVMKFLIAHWDDKGNSKEFKAEVNTIVRRFPNQRALLEEYVNKIACSDPTVCAHVDAILTEVTYNDFGWNSLRTAEENRRSAEMFKKWWGKYKNKDVSEWIRYGVLNKHNSQEAHSRAVNALIKAKDTSIKEQMRKLLNHEDPHFRLRIARGLWSLGDHAGVPVAVKVLKNNKGEELYRIVLGLGGLRHAPLVRDELLKLLTDKGREIRLRAAILYRFNADDLDACWKQVSAIFEDKDEHHHLRIIVLRVCSATGYKEAVDLLLKTIRSDDDKFLEESISALAGIGDTRAIPHILERMETAPLTMIVHMANAVYRILNPPDLDKRLLHQPVTTEEEREKILREVTEFWEKFQKEE
ncbi:MAG: hypothetical protein DRO93_14270 [Candidatus Thorarchaeota archaeon]|nr:MAG: hypothetical protein DRO93_14270 [Candidatus Thorarchaeota archaeon]